jgi:sugar O-acyltransferase (sialic acid O-acetyltransferase NeuD family)
MKKIRPVIILGAGENGQVIENILRLTGRKKIVFLDDKVKKSNVIGSLKSIDTFNINEFDFFISIGNNEIRKQWFIKLKKLKICCINAIHPSTLIESSVRLGENIMIGARTYINIQSIVQNNVTINNGCIIEHDNYIGEHSQICPGVITGGKVNIKNDVFIGMGSLITDHVTIEKHCIIGAGSLVLEDTVPYCLYMGKPAKKVKKL